jgi:CheY-like chemotaxis protein
MTNGKKVLIVDDEESFLSVVAGLLADENYETLTASTLADAMGYFEARKPNVVVTDLNVGNENGLDFVRQIREYEKTATGKTTEKIRIVMMTAADIGSHVKLNHIGVDHIFRKGDNEPAELLQMIEGAYHE